jgi:1-acyl-sn-glycerol-3-phosphate acyltransferase
MLQEGRQVGRFLYWFSKFVLGPIVKAIWMKRVGGLMNLPAEGPVVLAANHVSFLDFALLVVACPRRVYFLVEDFFYHLPVVPLVLRASGQVRVSKDRPLAAIEEASRILARGDVLAVFPEGTRSWTGEPQRAFTGLGKIALDGKADIIPVAIEGAFEVYPRQRKIPRFKKLCQVEFLEPVRYRDVVQRAPRYIVHRMVMPRIAQRIGHEYQYLNDSPRSSGAGPGD